MQRRARGPPCFLLVVLAPLLLLAAAVPAPAWSAPSDDQPAYTTTTSSSSTSSSSSSATAGCRGRSSAGIGGSSGSSRSLLQQQQQQLTPANSSSVLPAAAASANASGSSNATVVAANYTCRLAIVGFRNSSPAAVQWASLECSPASPPLRVGFNSSISGLNASSGNFSSVQLVPDGGLPCQAAFSQRSQFGLLFFCDDAPAAATAAAGQPQQRHTITLLQPLVQGVQLAALPTSSSSSSSSDQPPSYDAALLVFGGSVRAVLRGAQLSDNRAGTPLLVGDAAAVEVTDGSRLAGNTATAGGAIKAAGAASVVVSGGSVLSGNAAEFAGALHVSGSARLAVRDGVLVELCNASISGGGLLAQDNATVVVDGCVVRANQALRDGGGAVLLGGVARAAFVRTSVLLNRGRQYGGGFYLKDNASLVMSHSHVSSNSAVKQGGAMAVEGAARCRITSCVFDRNACQMQGAGLFLQDGADVVVDGNSSFVSNRALRNGGAVLMTKGATLTVSGNVSFVENVGESGAAINLYNDGLDSVAGGCVLTLRGGVVFSRNRAEEGAAAIVARARCRVEASGVLFLSNWARKTGGAVVLEGSAANFSSCLFYNNSAADGGAMFLAGNASVFVGSSLFQEQHSSGSGGSVAAVDGARLIVSSTQMTAGSSLYGGTLSLADDATAEITAASNLWSNTASVSGGAAYISGRARLAFSGGSICQANSAATSGGCVMVLDGANLSVASSCQIFDNRARFGGAAAFVAWTRPVSLEALQPPAVANNSAASFEQDVFVDFKAVSLAVRSVIDVNGSLVFGTQLAANGSVLSHVSRSSGRGLRVTVAALGFMQRPASGLRLTAALLRGQVPESAEAQSTVLAATSTVDYGLATFGSLVVREAPGCYTLRFEYINLDGQAFRAQVALAVRPCKRGEVSNGRPDVCDVCPPGQFSLAARPSRESSCQPCSPGMDCSLGGAVVLPAPGYYTFSPATAVLHRCPNPAACLNNPRRLLQLHPFYDPPVPPEPPLLNALLAPSAGRATGPPGRRASDRSAAAFVAAQCAVGYTGPLCAACSPGHGQTRQFRCGMCYPPATVAGLFAAAAVALMCGIRLLTHFCATSDAAAAAAAAAAASHSAVLQRVPRDSAVGPPAEHIPGAADRPAGRCFSSDQQAAQLAADPRVLPSSLLKVLVLYMQYMVLIGGLAVAWPAALAGPLTALAGLWSFTSSEALSLECLGRPASMPAGVLRVLVYVCMPLVMFCLLVALEWPAKAAWLWARAALARRAEQRASGFHGSVTGFHKTRRQAVVAAAAAQQQQQQQQRHQQWSGHVAASPAGSDAWSVTGLSILTSSDAAGSAASVAAGPAAATRVQCSPSAAAAAAAASPAPVQPVASRPWSAARPTAAWCGVLAMVIVFFFYPSLARATLGLFVCISLRGDTAAAVASRTLWLVDLQQECLGPGYKAWALGLGVPLLLVVFVCLPVSVGVLLWVGRRQGQQQWLVQHFTFLFAHYRPGCYMWEVVTMLQTLLLVVVSVFAYQLGPFYQALLLNAVLAVIAVMLLWFRPYATRRVQHVAVAAVACQLLTSYAALSFMSLPHIGGAGGGSDDDGLGLPYDLYRSALGVVVLAVNVVFVGTVLVALVHVACQCSDGLGALLMRAGVWPLHRRGAAWRRRRRVGLVAARLRVTISRHLGIIKKSRSGSSARGLINDGGVAAAGGQQEQQQSECGQRHRQTSSGDGGSA